MRRHQQPPYGNGYSGLGGAVAGEGDSLSFAHNGRDEGFVADMFMWPNRGRGLVIMINGVGGGVLGEIERAFAEEYGFGAPPRIPRNVVAMTAVKLGEYAGHYVGVAGKDTTRLDVTVAPDGKMLAVFNAAARRTIPLAPVGGDLFVGLEGGGEWPFDRGGDPNGTVKSIVRGAGPNRQVLMRQ